MPSPNLGSEGRVCTSCGSEKSWEDFDKKADGVNGRHSRCKECISKQKRAWWKKKKNMKKRIRPSVLDFTNHDLVITEVALTGQEQVELEKQLRRLVVDALIRGRST